MEKYLVVSEVSRKQSYIFKSNKLKENIGASVIIEYVTENLPNEHLQINNGTRVYEGGGRSLFLFDKEKDTINFIKQVTTEVLIQFPGIEFFMAYEKFDNSKEDITVVIDKVYKALNTKKNKRQSVFRRYSYGIEEICTTTQSPAMESKIEHGTSELISRESKIKRKWSNPKEIKHKKQSTIDLLLSKYTTGKYNSVEYKFPLEIDQLGIKKGENSYVAIVSLDGNKMGQKLEAFKKRSKKKENQTYEEFNREYTYALETFSKNIKTSYEQSFEYMIEKVIDNYDKLQENIAFNLKDNVIPIRPIILAGDDVCFICDARLALECVKYFMEMLNTKEIEEYQLNACAGISMVKCSYPFDKAYEIAESLCKSSKAKLGENEDSSLIDWHISQGEISSTLSQIREKAHINKDIKLNIKPLYINNDKKFNNYGTFKNELLQLRKKEEESRNKIRRLRDVFPQGYEKTRIFMNKYKLESLFKGGFGIDSSEYGFAQKDCLYFDIVEIIDLFESLD